MDDQNKTDIVTPEDVVGVKKDKKEEKPVFGFPEKKKKPEATPAVKEEKKVPPVEPKGVTPPPDVTKSVLITEVDTYLTERMKTQPQTLEEVTKVAAPEKEPGRHRLSLPKPLERHTQEFAFHWILRSKRAIDEAIDKGWVFVNRQLFPKLPNYLFSVAGAIEKGDLILACMGRRRAEAKTREAQQKSSDMVNVQIRKHEEDPKKFYKPTLSKAEENDETTPGLQEGRDFGKDETKEE